MPVPIRDDFGPHQLRTLTRRERDGRVCVRPHARAHVLDDGDAPAAHQVD
jgi:hypothetical protein